MSRTTDRSSRLLACAMAGAFAMTGPGTAALAAQEEPASPLAAPAEPLDAVRAAFTAAPGVPRFLAVLSPT